MTLQAWSVPDVRAAENAAMAQLPDGELMQRAARGLAAVARARLTGRRRAGVVGLVGSGGNGGDTLYALSRLARRRESDDVVAVLVTDKGVHPGGLEAAQTYGVRVLEAAWGAPPSEEILEAARGADLVMDGLTGIGGRPGWAKGARLVVASFLEAVRPEAYIIAVDLPSGADPEGEQPESAGVWADETVTFGVCKGAHLLATADRCGLLTVVDIGLEMTTPPAAERLVHDDVARLWPVPGRNDDKYSRGVLGVVAGGEKYPGAAALCVSAAVCAGAGMVRYIGPPTPTFLVCGRVPEVVLGPPTGSQRVQAWVVGPGLDPSATGEGLDAAQVAAAREALASGLPAVVDAGGLDLLDGPRPGAGARTLLTPHAGELARLLTRLSGRVVSREEVAADPVRSARSAAEKLHATVLLKGHRTYVVPPPGSGLPVRAQADAPAWMATAGSGDVLAGIAGTLLAAGLDPLDTGSLAALVHGLAGEVASRGGPVRALAVAQSLGGVLGTVLARREGLSRGALAD